MRSSSARSSSGGRRARTAAYLVFAIIVALGVWLRLDQITEQILADDEWHTLTYLLAHGYKSILVHFGISDHCIPMTFLDKLLADTIGLSELTMRAWPLIAGIAALIVLPALVLPRVGIKTALLFAALLSISPVQVYFSRYARPYAVIFLLALVGVLAFERFQRTGARRWGWVYVACAILVPWFHPLMEPFMLAPLAFALVRDLTDRARLWARARELWPFAAVLALGLAVLLTPPLLVDFTAIRARSGQGTFEKTTFRIGYDLLSGTERPLTRLLFAGACLLGLVSWFLRRRRCLAYFSFLFACQAAAIAYSMPESVGVPITALRYVLPVQGVVLLLAAEGLSRIDRMLQRESRGWLPRHLPSAAIVLAFVAWSPVTNLLAPENAVYFRPNAWTNHALYQYQYAEEDREIWRQAVIQPARISSFYSRLAQAPADAHGRAWRIVEAPWCLEWSASPFVIYQKQHRWPMAIGFVHEPGEPPPYGELPWPDARLRFRNFVELADFEGLAARDIAYVVLHKNLAAEIPHAIATAVPELNRTLARYTEHFGRPCFEDEDLIVFDVRSSH
jgi:predicted membrane-bound mannosyltransferase